MKKIVSVVLGIILMINVTFAYSVTITKDDFAVRSNAVSAGTVLRLLSNKAAGATYTVTSGGITINSDSRTPTMGVFSMPSNDVAITVSNEVHVNQPLLGLGMTPVNFDIETREWVDTSEAMWEWDYNSVANETSDGTIKGNGAGKWANARSDDGSMWVWIPRYTYKIESGSHTASITSWNSDLYEEGTSTPGKILIKFSNGTTDDTSDGYIAHPAFSFGDSELEGFWVAKYEMSMETDGVNTNTSSADIGNVVISDSIKAVSKPGVRSWRNISIGNAFSNSYNYNRMLDSHLLRNTEWGAVAYLTNAIGRIPYINNNNQYLTGISGDAQNSGQANSTINSWNTEGGVKASTTHNVYGVYDLSGGCWEFTSAYYEGGNSTTLSADVGVNTYGGALYEAATGTTMTKYVEVYNPVYDAANIGDGVYETSSASSGSTSWDGDYSIAPGASNPFFVRGGGYSATAAAGVFYFRDANGTTNASYGFRVALAIK